MAAARLKINDSWFQDTLNGGNGVAGLLEGKAQAVLGAAQAAAPVDSGEYVDSLHIETARTDRMVVRIVASAPHAFVVEARDGVLAKAASAAG